jgi:hypothetical protein
MKRKHTPEVPHTRELHSLPWELVCHIVWSACDTLSWHALNPSHSLQTNTALTVTLGVTDASRVAELRHWVAMQRVSRRWAALVDRYLADDLVLNELMPAKLPSGIFGGLGDTIAKNALQLAMASCSERLFRLLGGAEWLLQIKKAVYQDQPYYYVVPPEFLALLEEGARPALGTIPRVTLESCGVPPHRQLDYLVRLHRVVAAARNCSYAYACPLKSTSACGKMYVHRCMLGPRQAGAPFVRTKPGVRLYLDDLTPVLQEDEPVRFTECYELQVNSRPAGQSDLYRGQSLLYRLAESFALVAPLLHAQGRAVAALNIPLSSAKTPKKRVKKGKCV